MVVLHYKKSDLNQFLFETTCDVPIEDLLNELCAGKSYPTWLSMCLVNNMRLKLDRASIALEDLAAKGPLKPEELRGLKDYDDFVKNEDITTINGLKKIPPRVGQREVVDDTHYRLGWLLSEEMTKMMLEESMKTKELIHKSQVDRKVNLSMKMLTDQLDIIRGIVMMAYPAYYGLGEWEPIKVILENNEEFDEKMNLTDDLNPENSTIWIVGKELQKGKRLSDYFGKNEKQKLVVKV